MGTINQIARPLAHHPPLIEPASPLRVAGNDAGNLVAATTAGFHDALATTRRASHSTFQTPVSTPASCNFSVAPAIEGGGLSEIESLIRLRIAAHQDLAEFWQHGFDMFCKLVAVLEGELPLADFSAGQAVMGARRSGIGKESLCRASQIAWFERPPGKKI